MRVVDVQSIATLMKFWPFMLEGLKRLNESAFRAVDKDTLFRVCVDVVTGGSNGKLLISVENGNPMSYCIGFENTSRYSPIRTVLVYAIYSNGLKRGATGLVLGDFEKWAKSEGMVESHGNSQRVNGGAKKLWDTQFGYKTRSMLLVKQL